MEQNNVNGIRKKIEKNLEKLEWILSSNLLKDSFDYTGVCSRNNLHSTIKHIIDENKPILNYIVGDKDEQLDRLIDESVVMMKVIMKLARQTS